jgi:hypothetical protein
MSPAPTSELASSLQPKAGPSRASQVFFRPPTPAPDSASDNDMDTADVEDPDPTINIPIAPTSTPPIPPDRSAMLEGANADAFMADFDDPEAFYASGAKDKVLADLQAAMRSTHNLTETLNLWSHQGYCLDADATNSLVTELLQAVYTVSEISLIQHALAAGSETQSIALCALIESLRTQRTAALFVAARFLRGKRDCFCIRRSLVLYRLGAVLRVRLGSYRVCPAPLPY